MRPVVRDFLTGITALVGVVGLIAMLIIFGEMSNIGERYYTFTIKATTAGGLSSTSPVTLNGVRVGQVDETAIRTLPEIGATLKVRIREGVQIPRRILVSVDRSLVGDATLEFTVPPDATPQDMQDLVANGDILDVGTPSSLMGRLTGMVEEPLKRFGTTADKIDRLAEEYTLLGRRLNELMEPRTLADVQAGKAPNVHTAIARLDAALTNANQWLGDDTMLAQARDAVGRAGTVLGEASDAVKAWARTAAGLDEKAGAVSDQAARVAQQAIGTLRETERAADQLATALESLNQGQGTAGQLLKNPDLYNSMKDAATRLDQALNEFQLLVEKYRAEGIPINF